MSDRRAPRARRTPVAPDEPAIGGRRYDYADAFEIRALEPDARSPEQFARCALEQAAWPIRLIISLVHRRLFGFRLPDDSTSDHVLGWTIVASGPDLVHLEAASPLMRGAIVGRKVDPTHAVVSTYLFYERPASARVLWAITGPLHRRIAPYLLERAAAAAPSGSAAVHP